MKRRRYLAGIPTAILVGIAGCTGGETGSGGDGGMDEEDDTPEPDATETTPEPEETHTQTEEPTQFGLPSCSSGDYLFQVLNTGIENRALYINIKNLQATPVEISQVVLEMDFPDHGIQEVDAPMGTGGTGGKESFDGGESGSIFVEFDAFEDGVYLDNSDFEPGNIEDIRITNVHYDSDEYDGSVCE